MLKVFIVEDEIVVREGIKNIIPWEREGFVIVGDEGDGEMAYARILKERPEIIITDIKMPFMDGLELSKLVKAQLPQVKIIIISGHSDFSYAQQAIDIGIAEYILKPVTSRKLLAAVKNAAASIAKEREDQDIFKQYQSMIAEKKAERRNDFFHSLISTNISLAQIVEEEKEIGIRVIAPAMCIILFQYKATEDIYEYSRQIVQCENAMLKLVTLDEHLEAFERGMDGWAFLVKGEDDLEIQSVIENFSKALGGLIPESVHFFGGVGSTVNRIRDLQQSYIEANKAFSMRFFKRDDQFYSYKDVITMKESLGSQVQVSRLNLEKLDRTLLNGFLRRGTLADIEEFVFRYFDGLDAEAMHSALFQQYIMMDGYSAIVKFLKDLQYSEEKIEDTIEKMKEISSRMHTIEACVDFYKTALTEAITLRNEKSMKSNTVMIEKAKDCIRREYDKSDLTLDKVASRVNISPNYFSKLFNQETGMNFIEYLTEVRMEKAKNYLRCSNKKITEIGCLVGYLDSHYFSYIFRKTQNCTPSEYRLQGKGDL